MKKKVLVISCIAIAIAGALGVNKLITEKTVGNDLLLENVEALANGESSTASSIHSCFKQMYYLDDSDSGKNFVVRYCGDCKKYVVTRVWGESNCRL